MQNLAHIRQNYQKATLSKTDVFVNALDQFSKWMDEALNAEVMEPNCMFLSTVDESGQPSTRAVLLKEVNNKGFVFFTNYESKKALDIEQNNKVSLTFFWQELERQVRIEGIAQKISEEESEAYFVNRPRESQIGAWASPQSKIIPNRPILESKVEDFTKLFENKAVPKPAFWGGYLVKPNTIEFWQGRLSRLHDRIKFTAKDNAWLIERLAP